MRRMQLVELEDLPWFPAPIRDASTDYLQLAIQITNPYGVIVPHLRKALTASRATQIIDLGAGGGGPWQRLLPLLNMEGPPVRVMLTDRYPNLGAFAAAARRFPGSLSYHSEPVEAAAVPSELSGFRTIFSAFHHFTPEQGRAVIADAVRQGRGIGIFEATRRSVGNMLGMLITPLTVWLFTPMMQPIRPARLALTYLLPLVPATVLFDGVVSCLRSYSPEELRELVDQVEGSEHYTWEIGEESAPGIPVPTTYCIGYPRQ